MRTDEQREQHRDATSRYRRQQRRKGISPHGRPYKRHPAHPIIARHLEHEHPELFDQLMNRALDEQDDLLG